VATTERWSKALFNNAHLLSVAAAIGQADAGDDVTSQTLQSQLSLGQSSVQRVLSVLEEVELLKRLDRGARTDPVRFHRLDHAFWTAARDLAATAKANA
jgi:DNA-binding GntR family transcriptional regulator